MLVGRRWSAWDWSKNRRCSGFGRDRLTRKLGTPLRGTKMFRSIIVKGMEALIT